MIRETTFAIFFSSSLSFAVFIAAKVVSNSREFFKWTYILFRVNILAVDS